MADSSNPKRPEPQQQPLAESGEELRRINLKKAYDNILAKEAGAKGK